MRRVYNCFLFFFFFSSRRRHTRSDRDWSSDVCSSDLSRSRDLAATFPSGPINDSSPESGFSAANRTRNGAPFQGVTRSEERRVGKECRSRGGGCHEKKKNRINRKATRVC